MKTNPKTRFSLKFIVPGVFTSLTQTSLSSTHHLQHIVMQKFKKQKYGSPHSASTFVSLRLSAKPCSLLENSLLPFWRSSYCLASFFLRSALGRHLFDQFCARMRRWFHFVFMLEPTGAARDPRNPFATVGDYGGRVPLELMRRGDDLSRQIGTCRMAAR